MVIRYTVYGPETTYAHVGHSKKTLLTQNLLKKSSSFWRAAMAHCSSSSWFQFISSLNLRKVELLLNFSSHTLSTRCSGSFSYRSMGRCSQAAALII